MLLIAVVHHSSSDWQFLCTERQLNSDAVVVGILVLFIFAGVVGVGTSVKASS